MRYVSPLAPDTARLLRRLYKQSRHHRVRQRAHCILLSAQGGTIPQLMNIFAASRGTITNWVNAWENARFVGLYDASGKGRKPTFTPAQQAQIKQWGKAFPKNLKKVLALVKETFGISVKKRTIQRILKSLRCSWRRIRHRPKGKPDPQEYAQKKTELETFHQQEDEGTIDLVYFDESGFSLTSLLPYAWQELGETIELPAGDKRRLNVVGFLTRKGQLHAWTFEASINSDVVIACLDAFSDMISKETVVVIDNASFHTSDAVEEKRREWEAKGLKLFFLPTYSPHLNLIEILWRFMKYEWIDFDAYKGWENLVKYVEDVIIHYGTKYTINFV
jgi:transposase